MTPPNSKGKKFSTHIKLYPYQEEAVQHVLADWDAGHRRTLLVMATGTGKTYTFAEVIRRELKREWDANQLTVRALVLAHRDELINQAVEKIELLTGEKCAIEKASKSSLKSTERVVVGSVQSLGNESRLSKFPKDRFSLIVIDEAHHSAANTYLQILQHFPQARVLGVTATPDRGDQRSLARVFDKIAYRYDIADAIHDGYLCPITTRQINIDIDISHVSTVTGDYAANELGDTIAPYLKAVASQLAQICADRKIVIFLPLRRTAKMMAEFMTACGMPAREIDGESKDRKEILRDFDRGDFKVLCNSMLLTEGWDCPSVDCIVVLRPTQSRGLYAQMVGRGTRLSPKTGKKDLLLPDFIWLTGEHDVLTPVSLLGNDDPKIIAACKALLDSGAPFNLLELEKKAEDQAKKRTGQGKSHRGDQSLIDALTDPILSAEERERRARAMEEARKNAERRALVKILLDMLKEIQEYVKASKTTDSPIDALIKLLAIADLPGVSNKTRQRAQALSKLRKDGLVDPNEFTKLIGVPDFLELQTDDRSSLSISQEETLTDAGINPEGLTSLQAQLLLAELAFRSNSGLATPRQLWLLSLNGHENITNWTRELAALTLKEESGAKVPLDDAMATSALREWLAATTSQSAHTSEAPKSGPVSHDTSARKAQREKTASSSAYGSRPSATRQSRQTSTTSSSTQHYTTHPTRSGTSRTTSGASRATSSASRATSATSRTTSAAPRTTTSARPRAATPVTPTSASKPEKTVDWYVDVNKFERALGSRGIKVYSGSSSVQQALATDIKSLRLKGLKVPENLTRSSAEALIKQIRYREVHGYATPGQVLALASESVRDPGSWLKQDAEKYLREHGWSLYSSRKSHRTR